ncbi:protein phosphatase pp2a regulatory subunit b [Anaeramoeba ignava]|uniref:Serine/threonine-protein phosphatase 2A 55 kDa regulatory subunit B n=1 Tax=Anaeramoeba ignava TaxID=1746090 RepID=A0A9Q0LVF0_ANAIG|nr:protein phosphatase pp2a regulatory subunit b [Anaeramoeba ignava]
MTSHSFKVLQAFGDESPQDTVQDADIISALAFDKTGDYVAVGDHGGRIILFSNNQNTQNKKKSIEYKFLCEFQSHSSQFDYLKSVDIEEKVNRIQWLPNQPNARFLLSTNEKIIKLWKISNSFEYETQQFNLNKNGDLKRNITSINQIKFPRIEKKNPAIATNLSKSFQNGHIYNINSLSLNSDGETFLSADDLRINIWNLNDASQAFIIADIKPEEIEKLSDVITVAKFHPKECNIFAFATSKGIIRFGDLRESAVCSHFSKVMQVDESTKYHTFFTDIINSVSEIEFSPEGPYFSSRDFMSIKVWDIRKENVPVSNIDVHPFLLPNLFELYERDYFFDKFESAFSFDSKFLLTGSYGNHFFIYDWEKQTKTMVKGIQTTEIFDNFVSIEEDKKKHVFEYNIHSVDYTRKVLNIAYHPFTHCFVIAATNNIYIYSGEPKQEKQEKQEKNNSNN